MEFALFALPASAVLAIAALAGYALGRNWSGSTPSLGALDRRERKQAETVARELETIAQEVRRQLATHHASIERFRERLNEWRAMNAGDTTCEGLVAETEQMLDPTQRLAEGMARAYDQLRRQSTRLNSFQEVRRDSVTSLPNRVTLEHTLDSLLDMGERFGTHFCLLLIDFSGWVKSEAGAQKRKMSTIELNERLKFGADLAKKMIRKTDLIARFGAEELAIVLPQAEFHGAQSMAQRLSEAWENACGGSLPAGIARSVGGDTLRDVMKRADAALYCARTGSDQHIYIHDGERLAGGMHVAEESAVDAMATRDEAYDLAELLA